MCGIAGAFNVPDASTKVARMLLAIQHRGQECAGIISFDGGRMCEPLRGLGLVDEVVGKADLGSRLPGADAIGHVRYPTAGRPSDEKNIQPMDARTQYGTIALAYNGNMTNHPSLREMLARRGAIFRSDADTEVFLHLLSGGGAARGHAKRLADAFCRIEGSYSMLVLADDGTALAAVDPYGFRPLSAIRCGDGFLVASESRAFDIFGLPGHPMEIEPGCIVEFRQPKPGVTRFADAPYRRRCIFELVYFAMPDSIMFGDWVYRFRSRWAEALARKHPTDSGIVVPVPDSSNVYAQAYAEALGLRLRPALVRNHYTGRTFITPGQRARELGVRMKLNVIPPLVKGEDVILVDDSIVRGTSAAPIVRLVREAGARSVRMRIPSPMVKHSCFWGIATHDRGRLIAARHDIAGMAEMLGLDSLAFQSVDDFAEMAGDLDRAKFCYSCFTGEPPVPEHAPPCEDCAGCADGQ